MERKVSRRQFLRLAGGAAGAVALAACAPAAAPAGGGETSMSEEPIVIRYAGLDGMGARVEAFMIPWVEDNGYKLERGAFGQQELTDKIMQSVATDTYLADIFQFPSNARADVINQGNCI
ncbi:MAG: twin-arginine translocation signal domain-containing protein [Caldilineaceae bacterium]|nr:twin-arginine translocation signal domain-containing protein [Caldilineaceae bacterium]